MQKCWLEIPNDRPSFGELRQTFEDMLQQDNLYLELSNIDETKEYHLVPCDGVQEGSHGDLSSVNNNSKRAVMYRLYPELIWI